MGIGAAIGGIASGLMGARSASKAADAQTAAAQQQIDLQREIYQKTSRKFQPYYQAGNTALDAYMYEMGLGAAPSVGGRPLQITKIMPGGGNGGEWGGNMSDRQKSMMQGYWERAGVDFSGGGDGGASFKVGGKTFDTMAEARKYATANAKGASEYQGFTATPGYQFRVDEGNNAINAMAGAQGGLVSGATMQALQARGQNLASEEYGNYMNRLSGLTNMGMSAAGNQASAGANYASGASNALANMGNAQAAGYIGQGNALAGGINTGLNIYGYMQGLGAGGSGTSPGWFGGGK
jgi:hypothetical protein